MHLTEEMDHNRTAYTFSTNFIKQNGIQTVVNRRMLHGLLNMMTGVFTLPASIFCSADHRDLGLDILEDTAIVDVMDGITAFTDFKGLFPIQLMADDSARHFFGLLGYWHKNNGSTGHQEGHCCDLVAILSTRHNMT